MKIVKVYGVTNANDKKDKRRLPLELSCLEKGLDIIVMRLLLKITVFKENKCGDWKTQTILKFQLY